jgi:hypothetical protein
MHSPIILKKSVLLGFSHVTKKGTRFGNYKKTKKGMVMRSIIFLLACFLAFCLGSCSVVEGIFKAGMVWGILLVVGFIALIIFIIAKVSGGRK